MRGVNVAITRKLSDLIQNGNAGYRPDAWNRAIMFKPILSVKKSPNMIHELIHIKQYVLRN